MKRLMLIVVMITAVGVASAGVVGKDGSTLPNNPNPVANIESPLQAAWEWSTAGSMDFVPTLGGSSDGWGTHFLATTVNTSGQDMRILEFGWPCGGTIAGEWLVWLGASMPPNYSNPDFSGPFTATSPDPTTLPPTIYTYVDVSGANVVVPAGETVWFAYVNPGIGGQVAFNGVDTWSWYGGVWDPDQAWGRTAVMQLRADPAAQPTPTPGPGGTNAPVPTLSPIGLVALILVLAGIGAAILMRRR